MKAIDYNLDSKDLKQIVLENQPIILSLYNLIFDIRPEDEQEKEEK